MRKVPVRLLLASVVPGVATGQVTDDWRFILAPYFPATGVTGSAAARGHEAWVALGTARRRLSSELDFDEARRHRSRLRVRRAPMLAEPGIRAG